MKILGFFFFLNIYTDNLYVELLMLTNVNYICNNFYIDYFPNESPECLIHFYLDNNYKDNKNVWWFSYNRKFLQRRFDFDFDFELEWKKQSSNCDFDTFFLTLKNSKKHFTYKGGKKGVETIKRKLPTKRISTNKLNFAPSLSSKKTTH